jgi:hypothetical protein
MTKYTSILTPLISCKSMPLRETVSHVVFTNHREFTTSYTSTVGEHTTILEGGLLRTYTTSTDIVSISHETRLIYPQLPPGIKTPERDDLLGWVKATLRSVFNEVNQSSIAGHNNALVMSVNIDQIKRTLDVTMTGFWSTLPLFVRQRFLTLIWDVYGKLLVTYGVSLEYYRIEMYRYDNASEPIGYRSVYRSFIDGGLEITYNRTDYL